MTRVSTEGKHKWPWHIWTAGLFFILLHVMGAYDQAMLLSRNTGYFMQQGFEQVQIAYFTNYPLALAVIWVIAIYAGLAASVMLLLRTRWAYPAALGGFLAQVILIIVTFGFLDRWQMFGPSLSVFDFIVLLLTLGLVLYCRAMTKSGVLR